MAMEQAPGARLIFLYGPPAVGKLTVAKALARELGFRILHNHVTLNAVGTVLDFGTDAFWGCVRRLRRDLLTSAAKERVDLVYTFCFVPADEPVVEGVVEAYEREGGQVTFVQLIAPREELLRRVTADGRRREGKLTDAEALRRLLDEGDFYAPVRIRPSLTLDLGFLTADEAASRVAAHLSRGAAARR
jgi:DNA polymerase III delta prime subunit